MSVNKSGRTIQATRKVTAKTILLRWETMLVFLFLAVNAMNIAISPNYLNAYNLFTNVNSFLVKGMVALPMAYILLLGEIDPSVGSTVCLAATILGIVYNATGSAVLGILAALAVGLACGVINGVILTQFPELAPMIVTLATMTLFRGISMKILGDTSTSGMRDVAWFGQLYEARLGVVPYLFLLFCLLAVVFGLVIHRTVYGRHMFAVGTNRLAAEYAAVNVHRVRANDAEALESTLQAARDSGIVVVTLDSDAKGSQLFVNQAGVTEVGQVLVDSIYDMTGGEGQFAVLSATSTATNQNSWIAAMEQIIAGDAKYENLEWVVTVYGDDESQKSYDETESLMTNYPDLKVICCPTTVGILACAQAVQNSGSAIKVAGLGLPSEMNGYVGEGLPCPYMYLWNPIDVGACAAYAIQAFIDGATTGAVGETYTAGNGSTYEVIEKDESVGVYTPQVIVGPPFEFTADNIAEWAEVY